ncbi:hypothetical protein GCM10009557_03770 [Virgisporangium ochraceum]|uniref:Uncharacterized protein n=1 Tax=Virgisporangium ochraceum TaxID=65505 RepID=A0A8J4EFE7_9ACTN|nr:hypothetical protein [Virgisporangium ochraceum]GIJ72744.1 hypothetical protein Voc01_076610 [Virgisporangium ochraceum]
MSPSDGEAAVLAAVGARLTGQRRLEVLRRALQATRRIDDEELRMATEMTSIPVLRELARLLPGEVLPFVLEHRDPHESVVDWTLERLGAISPHLRTDELHRILRVARELNDGRDRCVATVALVPHVPEPGRSELLRGALSDCRSIHRHWDVAMALHALAPVLPYEMGEQALEIAESVRYEAGARARAEVARTDLYREALAVIGTTDWDETEALSIGFVASVAADLPEHMLDEVVDLVVGYQALPDDHWPALAALAARFDEPRRTTLLGRAVQVCARIAREPARVRALAEVGPSFPGAADVIRGVTDPWWRAVGLAHLGVPVPPDLLLGALDGSDAVQAVLELLPFVPPDGVRAVLSRLRAGPRWPEQAADGWFSVTLAQVLARLDPELLPDVLQVLDDIPATRRPRPLAALRGQGGFVHRRHLYDLWSHARAAFDSGGRKDVLHTVATLPELVDAVGGPDAVGEAAAAIRLVARWHP